jgi:Fe(3+) dicitrate transport protein
MRIILICIFGFLMKKLSAMSLALYAFGAYAAETTLPEVQVRPRGAHQTAAGAAAALDAIQLRSAHVTSTTEALRKLPGVHVRDEEGFGIRPNIGVRGLNPTRSTKVLLLEDGAPASFAPYGDNASYYHAPIERYERIEVLTGVEMLRFGPQSVGAVINYLTPNPSEQPRAYAHFSGGSSGFLHGQTRFAGGGFLLDLSQKQGDGARENTQLKQQDVNAKWQGQLGETQSVSLKASHLREDSQVGYTGITDTEFAAFGARYNPFANDFFDIQRSGLQLGHRIDISDAMHVETSVYASSFDRDWWRQSSTTTDTQCGTSFRDARLAGRAVNPDQCASVQGRLRAYDTRGLESRLFLDTTIGQTELGLRIHREAQDRQQVNGLSALARTGTLSENNERFARAKSAFIGQRLRFDALSMFPIVRFESADFKRINRLNGRVGSDSFSQVLPGIGLNYALAEGELFFGAHRGFSPPRVEDLIDGLGGSVDVGVDESRQFELGYRNVFSNGAQIAATVFRSDFRNQIAVGSIAGGGVPLAEGQALYQGLELSGTRFFDLEHSRWYVESALTWLPDANQRSAFRAVSNQTAIAGSASGLRMPYAPKHLGTLRLGWMVGEFELATEASHIGAQFADFANLTAPTGNGQFGRIGGSTQFHANLNWRPEGQAFEVFIAVKNLTDKLYVADRTRGLLFGQDRRVQIGVSAQF